ncbi:FAD-binding oxidoreductase [Promethearchaeum syntrophicum]|uniref:FAD-binding oxidoreductase n=1 Tax=Promethearchaeum syntrophicum TaxID=2594042 RepID=A0A5B9D801_9ARCH|nr:FAD-binding oxidoreductase [Candidatus Prometheoarchaeum syntrophicum]QEE15299.1 glycolate oxidase subunit GlcD [Candidatus Prometheoarchaeum syntrophicum]
MNITQKLEKLDRFTKEVEKFISSSHVSTDPYEIEATSADLSLLPKYHYKFKEEFRASHVIRPGNTEELSKVMKKCREFSLPVTIRAAATSCFSSSSPTRGGAIIDMRRMNKVHEIDADKKIVRCDAGISWIKLIESLLDYGLAPKCYPTSYKASCLGGFVASAGKSGIGVLKYGGIRDALVSVTLVKPDGSIEEITKDSKGNLTLDNIVESLGIYGAIAEIEMTITTLKTSLGMIGYGFKSFNKAIDFYLTLKNNKVNKPFFLSLSNKKFEKLAHKTLPTRDFFVYAVFFDDPDLTEKALASSKEAALKTDGLSVDEWYLKEKWLDIADTELNLGRLCRNPVFQEYWIADERCQSFYEMYHSKTKKLMYKNAFYIMAGINGGNRIKIFGLSDIKNPREFFGIKANFHELSKFAYGQQDRLYTIGVVNTFYFIKFNPDGLEYTKALKTKLDPENLVNSYRFVQAKMKYWRIQLLFFIAKWLYWVA